MQCSGIQLEFCFTFDRPTEERTTEPRTNQPTSKSSNRAIVLAIIDRSTESQKAELIAQQAGLTYKQTIYALNALLNLEKVTRTGRKFTSRWSRRTEVFAVSHGLNALERHFLGLR